MTRRFTLEEQMAVELAAWALREVAPEELPVLEEAAAEYFDEPRVLSARGRDTPLGSGLDLTLLAPYLVAVGGVVLPVLGAVVGDALKGVAADELKPRIAQGLHRLFRRSQVPPGAELTLSEEEAEEVHAGVLAKAAALGLPPEQCALLADAVVGSLRVRR